MIWRGIHGSDKYERIHHLKFKPISFETELLGNRGFESLNPDFRETDRGEIEK